MGREIETLTELIEAAKARGGFESYSALARRLGISQAELAHYRSGIRSPREPVLLDLAELAQVEPALAAVYLQKWKSTRPELWDRVIDALKKSAAALVVLASICALDVGPVRAERTAHASPSISGEIYIMRQMSSK